MRCAHRVAGLSFLAVALFVVWQSASMKYYTSFGPGPGFFPFWLGSLLAVLSVAWLIQISRHPAESLKEDLIPDRAGVLRIGSVWLALVLVTLLMEVIGFRLAMLGFLLFLLVVLGHHRPVVAVLISLAGSFGVAYVFKHALNMQLPYAMFDFLRNLGL